MADLRSVHVQRIRDAGIPVLDISLDRKFDREALKVIRETILSRKIDIVHAYTNRTVLHMVLAGRCLPVKLRIGSINHHFRNSGK